MTVHMYREIMNTYERATPEQITAGILWYSQGYEILSDIADRYSLSLERVAAIMAHLSPRISWTANVRACEYLCATQERRSGIMQRSYDMAMTAYNSDAPLSTLNGPKVSRFARNLLLLDMNCVTVDVWALRAAGVSDLDIKRKGAYDQVEAAYQEAASKLGILPAHFQAIVWIVTRVNHKRGQR